MVCNQCGTEFEGKFCPEYGTKMEIETSVTSSNTQQQSLTLQTGKTNKKKSRFFLRWWFILLVIIVIGIIAIVINKVGDGGDKIVWKDMILGDMLPKPPSNEIEVNTNAADKLWIDIEGFSGKKFNNYIEACKEKGFTVDSEANSYSYEAYNEKGYKLHLSYYDFNTNMSISLDAPLEMSAITWPTSAAGKLLPVPKSTKGKFSHEYENDFFVYVGDTSIKDYEEYVNACSEKGFNVDYNKGDKFYYADNSEGWHVSVCYAGNNIMTVEIDPPKDDDSRSKVTDDESNSYKSNDNEGNNDASNSNTEEFITDTTEKEPDDDILDTGGLDPEFKAAMDSYENFMDEYVSFMQKYKDNPSDMSLLMDYVDYLDKYTEVMEDFEKWEDEDMNSAELAYYVEVQARVTKKLLEVTQ